MLRMLNVIAGLAPLIPGPTAGQNYPTRPIRLIVPSPAGGGIDTLARLIGQHITDKFRQQVVVDARPGATGIIGTAIAAKATADGYTLLFAWTSPLAINPSLYEKLPYDVQRDFAPIILAATTPNVLVVKPDASPKSVNDYVQAAKRAPGKLTYGSSGIGGSSHLAGELFASMASAKLMHVPYKGTPPALVDIMAGRIDSMFAAVAPALPHIKANRLRAIAVTTGKRSAILPDLPAIAEFLPEFEAETWYALIAPIGTPATVISRLNREVAQFLNAPNTVSALLQKGFEPVGGAPKALSDYIRAETVKWGTLIKSTGIRNQ